MKSCKTSNLSHTVLYVLENNYTCICEAQSFSGNLELDREMDTETLRRESYRFRAVVVIIGRPRVGVGAPVCSGDLHSVTRSNRLFRGVLNRILKIIGTSTRNSHQLLLIAFRLIVSFATCTWLTLQVVNSILHPSFSLIRCFFL